MQSVCHPVPTPATPNVSSPIPTSGKPTLLYSQLFSFFVLILRDSGWLAVYKGRGDAAQSGVAGILPLAPVSLVVAFDIIQVLYLFVPAYVANMSPVLVKRRFERFAVPIDGGRCWRGQRILGDHKTWRGLIAGAVTGVAVYEGQRFLYCAGLLRPLALFDYEPWPVIGGLLMGVGALVGDAVKSFFKRRTGIAPGKSWLGFDQVDFYVGAAAMLAPLYAPPLLPFVASLPIVFVGDMATNALGYRLGLKDSWI